MSRGTVLNHTTALVTEDCFKCGVCFAIPKDLRNRRIEDKGSFWCPNGHSMSFTGDTEAEKLKKEKAQLERQLELHRQSEAYTQRQLEATRKQRTALKGQLTKTKKLVVQGKCPVPECTSKVKSVELARHMGLAHPDYTHTAVPNAEDAVKAKADA